ncbi:MAG: TRL-like family protein [Treponema sp.]|jgi:hypothetical protein|nr:TRL-like family protein [Treponema sp.]
MKKIVPVFLTALVVMAIAGCTTTVPVDLTNNPVGTKVGEASGTLNFGGALGGNADYSLQTAAKNGGITRIATVDLRVKSILGFSVTYTTIVTGE